MNISKTARNRRVYLLFCGLFISIVAIYTNYTYINLGEFPKSIMLVGAGINLLSLSYLAPHLYPKDERSEMIISKSMFYNYFIILAVIAALLIICGPSGFIVLDAFEVLNLLATIYFITIAITMLYFSKKL